MSSQQLVYEGTDLQALLEQVLDEHGPVGILPPERLRKTRMFGFFPREVYRISVDPRAKGSETHTEPAGGGFGPLAPSATADGRFLAPVGPATDAATGTYGAPLASPSALTTLVEATEDDVELTPLSQAVDAGDPTGSKPFEQVLAEAASSLGEAPGTYRAGPRHLYKGAGGALPAAPPSEAPDTAEAQLAGPSEVAQALILPLFPPLAPPDPPAVADALAPIAPPVGAPSAPSVAPLAAPASPAPPIAPPVAPSFTLAPPVAPLEPDEERPELGMAIVDALRAAGFPERMLRFGDVERSTPTMEAIFASLPKPPPLPRTAGSLVAVVGASEVVRPTTRALAAQVGLPPDHVAVASPAGGRNVPPEYRARSAEQAASLVGGWRRGRVGVVGVYAPPLGADQSWTYGMLAALRPSCTWGVVTATTKPEDVRRWVDVLGGVDALVLTEVAATVSPAAILGLGIPIARLDDQPATPHMWAAIVAQLLTSHRGCW